MHDLIFAFSFYCAGDLLLIFLSHRMKISVRFALATCAIVHFFLGSGSLLRAFLSDEFLHLSSNVFGVFGFLNLLFAIVLLFMERKTNRYLKYGGWVFLILCIIYGMVILAAYFTNQTMFLELIAPVTAATSSLHFYSLNHLLSVFIMIVITVSGIIEYIFEMTDNRIRLATLEQVNRLKTEFLGNVSHELKTPLTVMSSYAQLTEKSIEQQEGREDLLHHMKLIQSEADRLSLMVSQILDVTRIEENHLHISTVECDLTQIIKRSIDTYYPVFSKNRNKLIFNPSIEKIEVLCDPDRITQVIVNLISNAAKFIT